MTMVAGKCTVVSGTVRPLVAWARLTTEAGPVCVVCGVERIRLLDSLYFIDLSGQKANTRPRFMTRNTKLQNPERWETKKVEIKYIHMLDTHLNGLNISQGFLSHYPKI